MPPVMFSVITKYHKGRHSLFLYNSEIFYAFTQDILRSHKSRSLILLAGIPTYNPFGSVFFTTVAPAPITQPLAIVTPGSMVTLQPIQHPSPTVIASHNRLLLRASFSDQFYGYLLQTTH